MNVLINYFRSTHTSENMLLAQTIMKNNPSKRTKKIVLSKGFQEDPVAYLINKMVVRGVGMAMEEDIDRAYIIGMIPHFADKVESMDFLRSVAIKRYEGDDNIDKIMECFNRSLQSTLFQNHLQQAVKKFRRAVDQQNSTAIEEAEQALRLPLTIFRQSKNLEEYVYDDNESLE